MRIKFFRQVALAFVALALFVTPQRVKAGDLSCSIGLATCRMVCNLQWIDPDPPTLDNCYEGCDFQFAWCLWLQDV